MTYLATNAKPVVYACRGGEIESVHYGIIVHIDRSHNIRSYGDANFNCFTRSILKPIQAQVSKSFIGTELSDELLAIAISSHRAEPPQINAVKELMSLFSIPETDLYCGIHKSREHDLNSAIKNNCSGKHAAMLAACIKQNWTEDYYRIDHPLQLALKAEIQRLMQNKKELISAIDGCGIPTFYLSLKEMSELFLAMIQDRSYLELITTMLQYPFLIGGQNQIDSLIMNYGTKRIIAKGGAEGLMMLANLEKQEVIIIKIIDGSERAKKLLTIQTIEFFDWVPRSAITIDTNIYNSLKQPVGDLKTPHNLFDCM